MKYNSLKYLKARLGKKKIVHTRNSLKNFILLVIRFYKSNDLILFVKQKIMLTVNMFSFVNIWQKIDCVAIIWYKQ